MFIRDILETKGAKVFSMYPDASVAAAVAKMDEQSIGAIVVIDRKGAVQGIVSERDVVRALSRHGADALQTPVGDLMTTPVRTRGPDTEVAEIMSLMTYQRCRHVPIVEDGRLVGLVSIGDVVKQRLKDMELEVGVLRDVARVTAQ
ncbi:MAG: CBS domain-containing protein [Rhodospirillales bacterium]